MPTDSITSAISGQPKIQQSPSLRVVLTPEREQELVDPAEIESEEFRRQVFEIGHSSAVRLMDYSQAKRFAVKGDTLAITALDERGAASSVVELNESGFLTVDASLLSGKNRDGFNPVVPEENIESLLRAILKFYGGLYDRKDPYGRNQQFFINCALLEMGHYGIERNPQPRSSYTMTQRGSGPLVAYDAPRIIGRNVLLQPEDEVSRALLKLNRAAKPTR